MKKRKESTVCFTGYYTSKLLPASKNPNFLQELTPELERTILELYKRGYTIFMSGMSDGFDMLAAEVVLRLRIRYPKLQLVAVIPFMGQELGYSDTDKERYDIIYKLADEVVFTSEIYHSRAYLDHNDYLFTNSSVVIC